MCNLKKAVGGGIFVKGRFIFCTALIIVIVLFFGKPKYSVINSFDSEINEPLGIRLMNNWNMLDSRGTAFQTLINNFNAANPDIKVVNFNVPEKNYITRLKVDFCSGHEPDIFVMHPGRNSVQFIQNGLIAPLNSELLADEQWFNSIDKSTLQYLSHDGNIYAIPFEIVFSGLFVNTDILEECGASVPTTFDEFKDCVRRISAHGIIPVAFNTTSDGLLLYQMLSAFDGGPFYINDIRRTDGSINEHYLNGADLCRELYDLGAFPPNAFSLSDYERNELFLRKEAAMIAQNSSFAGNIYNASVPNRNTGLYEPADTTVKMIPFPSNSPTYLLYGVGGNAFFASSDAWQNPQKHNAALKFLKYITSAAAVAEFSETAPTISAVKFVEHNKTYNPLMINLREVLSSPVAFLEFPETFVDGDIWADFSAGFPGILSGTSSAEAVWQSAFGAYYDNSGR